MSAPSGYTDCPCRDCFDIGMDGDLCHECQVAGCVKADDPDYQHPNLRHSLGCQREDAYGMGDGDDGTEGEGGI